MPGVEQFWNDIYARVVATGETYQSEQHSPGFGRWFEVEVSRVGDESDRRIAIVFQDITERKRAEALLAAEKKVLELIATDWPLPEVLGVLMRETEAQSTDGMLCSVLLADETGQRLLHGAAPSLPEAYNEAIHGLVIGPSAGSCGTAAFERKPVFVNDVAGDPLWSDFKHLAASHGLGACHSTPIVSSQGRLLGTIAMYYRRPHNPGAHDRHLIERATQLAGIVIERRQAEESLRLAKFSVDRAADAVYWIDPQAQVLDVNEVASRMLGYSKDELCAMTVHDLNPEFQADMWPGFWEETRKRGTMVIETCHKAKNGRLIPIEVSVNFLSYEGKEYHCAFVRDITERKRGQDALSASEARFRSLVSHFPGAVYRCACDSDWTMEFLSDPIEHLCGYPASDFLASRVRSYNSVIHPNDRQMVARVILDAVAQRRPYTIEYRLLHKDGGVRWVYEKGQGIFAADGQVLWLDGAIFDITERRRTEEALRRSEVFITSVVENLPNMIFVKDAKDLTFVRFNKTGEDLLGHSREALMGKSDYDFFPKEEADFFTQTDRQVLQTGGLLDIPEEVIETKHQGLRILHTKKIPIYDDTGEPRYLLGISEDITERKRTEEALKKSEDRYRSIFEKAVDGIFQTTPDGKYVAVNPALARIYGYDSPDDMIATITDIASQLYVDPGRRDEFLRAMQAQEEVTGFEALVYRKDGSFIWISESARTLRDQAGTVVGYEGTVENITERKRAEGRLRATLDHVRTLSGRLATVQEEERAHIARELHDELGVRLTCLKIDLSRVMSLVGTRVRADLRAKLNDRVRSMVGQVDSTIASLQQLVTKLRPALLDDLGLVAAIEWQSQDFQKRTGISCTCVTNADDIAMAPERATAVFRICQEALTNTARHAQATAVTITVTSQPDLLQLVVADNGVGVPDAKASDRRSLGLLGMQERAAQWGGTVTIEGDLEKGTTVTLCLPVGGGQTGS
jgi:PAS domain S-box-containing protein